MNFFESVFYPVLAIVELFALIFGIKMFMSAKNNNRKNADAYTECLNSNFNLSAKSVFFNKPEKSFKLNDSFKEVEWQPQLSYPLSWDKFFPSRFSGDMEDKRLKITSTQSFTSKNWTFKQLKINSFDTKTYKSKTSIPLEHLKVKSINPIVNFPKITYVTEENSECLKILKVA